MASALATAATSPHTCTFGKIACVINDRSHAPLPSPLSASRSVSIVHGPLSGPAPSVVACMRPKNAPSLTLPFRIGRNHQWSGMWLDAESIDAARSGVRARHDASSAQSAAYRWICSPVVLASQRKWPGGLTPIMTERWIRCGYRQA